MGAAKALIGPAALVYFPILKRDKPTKDPLMPYGLSLGFDIDRLVSRYQL